jgi:hypothetical protein
VADETFVIGGEYTGRPAFTNLFNDLSETERRLLELSRINPQAGSREYLQSLSGVLREQFSALDRARAGLENSILKDQEVAAKIKNTALFGGPSAAAQQRAKDFGLPAGTVYGSETQQRIAQNSAFIGRQGAAERLQKEYDKASGAVQQAAQADRALAATGKILGKFQQDRAKAEETAARAAQLAAEADNKASRLRSVDAEFAALQPQRYASPDLTTNTGRLKERVNAAEVGYEIATRRRTAAFDADNRTVESMLQAHRAYLASQAELNAATRNLAVAQGRQATGASGLIGQFQTGFKGVSDRPYAEQIGQAFKFSVLYGSAYKILFGITQTLQATLQEAIAFQQSMTELKISSGRTEDSLKGLSENLGRSAVEAGFSPSQGVLVGARSLGLFGATEGSGATAAEQDRIAEISARVVSRIAMGSGQQPADIQSNLAAIAQAFGTGAEGQIRAYDLDAFLTKKFGVPVGSTLAGASEAGTVGKAAGFSQEQVQAIAAQLQSRVGVSPEAVAGYMAQIFSRAGEGSLVSVDQKYGINPQTSLANQFNKLADIYAKNPSSRDDIAAVGGRGKVQSAFIAMLQDWQEIQRQVNAAKHGGAEGAGDAAFQQRLKNLGGELAQTMGAMKDFASALAQTGLLEVLGAGVIAFREMLQAVTAIIRVYNSLGDTTHRVVEGLVAFLVATRLATGGNLLTSAGRATALASGGGILASGGGAHAAEGAFLANAKGFALAGAVLGDVYLWSQFRSATTKLTDAENNVAGLLSAGLPVGATPDMLRARASALTDSATQSRESTSGFFANLSTGKFGINHDLAEANRANAELADSEAKRLNNLANLAERLDKQTNPTDAIVTSLDPTALQQAMDGITASGGTAQDQLDALNASILGTADAAGRLSTAFNPTLFAGDVAGNIFSALQTAISFKSKEVNWFGSPFDLTHMVEQAPQRVRENINPQQIQTRIAGQLSAYNQSGVATDDLNNRQLRGIAGTAIEGLPEAAFPEITDPKKIAEIRKKMIRIVVRQLQLQIKGVKGIIDSGHKLTGTELTTAISQANTSLAALLGSLPETDYLGRIDALKGHVHDLRAYIRDAAKGTDLAGAMEQLDLARRQLAEQQITRLEALRRAAQHQAKTDAEVKSIGRSFFTKELNRAIASGSRDVLVHLIETAGDWSISIARNAIKTAIATARAAVTTQAQAAAFASAELAGIKGMAGRHFDGLGGPTSAVAHQLEQLQAMLAGLGSATPGNLRHRWRPRSPPRPPGSRRLRRRARSPRSPRPGLRWPPRAPTWQQPRRAPWSTTPRSGPTWRPATSSPTPSRPTTRTCSCSPTTPPTRWSRPAPRCVLPRPSSADAGKPADVRAADRVALQASQAELESTRFSQRLEAAQTAEQLGRTSHRAYINYLDHEHDRLRASSTATTSSSRSSTRSTSSCRRPAARCRASGTSGTSTSPSPTRCAATSRRTTAAVCSPLVSAPGRGPRPTPSTSTAPTPRW